LKSYGIERLLDIRLNNTSQLAGFAKASDLPYFLREICGVDYEHEPLLAPTQDILDAFKKNKGSWEVYERAFLALLNTRQVEAKLSRDSFLKKTVLLCSEATPEHCHRRLVIEYLQQQWDGVTMRHL